MIRLWFGNCLPEMKRISNGSVDMILCDLPYGITACKWDSVIPLEPMWKHLERVIKLNGAIVLFGSQPFTSLLIMSNLKMFRYELIWDKVKPSGMFNANKMPMRSHENILVFYKKLPVYHPQKKKRNKRNLRPNRVKNSLKKPYQSSEIYFGKRIKFSDQYEEDKVNPNSIITISKIGNASCKRVHPTQKPVALMEYLIKTYSDENDLVLDFAMGSGTTGIACNNLNRNFIGIEKNKKYFNIAGKRIREL